MITAAQLRAARALASLDQRKLAELSGLSLPTIQRMETSEDLIRGNVDSLTKLIAAFEGVGIEFLREGVVGSGGDVASGLRSPWPPLANPRDRRSGGRLRVEPRGRVADNAFNGHPLEYRRSARRRRTSHRPCAKRRGESSRLWSFF